MSSSFARHAASALCLAACLSSAVFAQSNSSEKKSHDLQAAGFKALKAKAYAEAIRDFQDAYALTQHSLLLGMISRAQLEQGSCADAVGSAKQFVAVAAPEDVANARKLAGQVLDQCVQLTVQSEPSSADLFIDGQPQHPTPWIGWLKAGDHLLLVKLLGREQSQPLHVPAAERQAIEVTIHLPKAAEPKPAAKPPSAVAAAPPIIAAPPPVIAAPKPKPQVATIAVTAPASEKSYAPPATSDVLFGLAAAGAALAIVEGVQTNKCASQVTNPAQLGAAADCQSTHAKIANFAWLGAGVFAAAGGVIWIVHATSDGEQHGVAVAGLF